MLIWSAAGILEKNKLANDKPFLVLFQITVPSIDEPIRLVRDNQECMWNGHLWQPFPVDFDDITEDGKEIPAAILRVSNIKGLIQGYVQRHNGFCDSPVKLIIVHAAHLDNPIPEMELDFVITQTKYDEEWVSFTIGASNDHSFRFPPWKYMTNFCPYRFKDIRCGYAGSAPECDGTLKTCRIRTRFGGEPGIKPM
ncbi:DUF1833 family protein [Sporomusa sphaeroides DSM 2875]|uniref:DUF1833 family protein n=1 Tax=Sporomusa sphaeroides TaxID=47679 RepID=UPI00202EF6E7|nr:DUF1833 family protein [Sporomusa sphaeroides]MCM0760661.1 DUF1833 family protein [Sporomusa sphaeroides DSM 2875]